MLCRLRLRCLFLLRKTIFSSDRGGGAVVNLTLATLFDASAWLPAERRKTDEPGDDWKWTLRSTANRPMLRMVDDGSPVLISSSAAENKQEQIRTKEAVSSGDGEFGHGGTHNILSQNREMIDGSDLLVRMDVGLPSVPIGIGPSTEIDTGFGRQLGFAGATRTVLSYQNHPEIIRSGGGADVGLSVTSMQMASAEQIALGDTIKVEAGSEVYAVRTVRTVAGARPFIRVAMQPTGAWTVGYRMATSRELQGFADLDAIERDLPVAVTNGKNIDVEHGQHQEVSLSRKVGSGIAQVAYYHDSMDHPAIGGGGLLDAGATAGRGGGPRRSFDVELPLHRARV